MGAYAKKTVKLQTKKLYALELVIRNLFLPDSSTNLHMSAIQE